MRWKKKPKKEVKFVKKFAFLPICVGPERRWLEMCYLKKEKWYDWGETGWSNTLFYDTKEAWLNAIKEYEQEEFRKKLEVSYLCHQEKCKHNKDHWCSLGHEAKIDNNGVCYSKEVE